MNPHVITQLGILIFCMSAVFLVNASNPKVRRWGSVMGLLGQPFWFYETYTQAQWGIFACSFVYTASWAMGFYNSWLKKEVSEVDKS